MYSYSKMWFLFEDEMSETLTLLGFLDRVVGVLQKFGDNRLNVLAYISRLRQGGTITDGEGHIQAFSQSLGQQGFTYPCQ